MSDESLLALMITPFACGVSARHRACAFAYARVCAGCAHMRGVVRQRVASGWHDHTFRLWLSVRVRCVHARVLVCMPVCFLKCYNKF